MRRYVGWCVLAIALLLSLLLWLVPAIGQGLPSWLPIVLAVLCILVGFMCVALHWKPKEKLEPDDFEARMKEADWFLQTGDLNEAWQAYVKARRIYNALPPEKQAELHERVLTLYGELEKAGEFPKRAKQ